MEKEEILAISRRENKNRDLAEAATAQQAGNIAGRVGACVCCLVSVVFVWATGTMLYSPWVIYFSILGTHSLVTYRKRKGKRSLRSPFCILPCFSCSLFFSLYGSLGCADER